MRPLIPLLLLCILITGCGHKDLTRAQVHEALPHSKPHTYVPQDPKVPGSVAVEQRWQIVPRIDFDGVARDYRVVYTHTYRDDKCVAYTWEARAVRVHQTYGPSWVR